MAIGKRIGKAWGNALGGYKFQNRSKGGKFASGFSGSVGSRSVLTSGQRRAQYLQRQKRKGQAKKAAGVVAGAAVVAGGGYLAYRNRGAIGSAISGKTIDMGSVTHDVDGRKSWGKLYNSPRAHKGNRGKPSPSVKSVPQSDNGRGSLLDRDTVVGTASAVAALSTSAATIQKNLEESKKRENSTVDKETGIAKTMADHGKDPTNAVLTTADLEEQARQARNRQMAELKAQRHALHVKNNRPYDKTRDAIREKSPSVTDSTPQQADTAPHVPMTQTHPQERLWQMNDVVRGINAASKAKADRNWGEYHLANGRLKSEVLREVVPIIDGKKQYRSVHGSKETASMRQDKAGRRNASATTPRVAEGQLGKAMNGEAFKESSFAGGDWLEGAGDKLFDLNDRGVWADQFGSDEVTRRLSGPQGTAKRAVRAAGADRVGNAARARTRAENIRSINMEQRRRRLAAFEADQVSDPQESHDYRGNPVRLDPLKELEKRRKEGMDTAELRRALHAYRQAYGSIDPYTGETKAGPILNVAELIDHKMENPNTYREDFVFEPFIPTGKTESPYSVNKVENTNPNEVLRAIHGRKIAGQRNVYSKNLFAPLGDGDEKMYTAEDLKKSTREVVVSPKTGRTFSGKRRTVKVSPKDRNPSKIDPFDAKVWDDIVGPALGRSFSGTGPDTKQYNVPEGISVVPFGAGSQDLEDLLKFRNRS